jgi:hypothetical protein
VCLGLAPLLLLLSLLAFSFERHSIVLPDLILAATKLTRNWYEQPGKCMSSSNKMINEMYDFLYVHCLCVYSIGANAFFLSPLLIWNMMTYWKLLSKRSFGSKLFFFEWGQKLCLISLIKKGVYRGNRIKKNSPGIKSPNFFVPARTHNLASLFILSMICVEKCVHFALAKFPKRFARWGMPNPSG